MVSETKGTCVKHGEFILTEGCPQCLRKEVRIAEGVEAICEPSIKLEEVAVETALALRPGEDVEARGYFHEALKLLEYAEARVITTIEDVKLATDDLSVIAKLKKVMENKRKSLLDPLKLQADAIRETYNYLMTPVLEADKITRGKMLAFDTEQRRIRAEQERINALRLEAAQKEMELNGELSESVNLVEVAPEPAKSVSTDMGTTRITTIWKWEVIDLSLVPDEYKILDAAKVGKVVRAGLRSIPGIRIYPEESLRVTTQ